MSKQQAKVATNVTNHAGCVIYQVLFTGLIGSRDIGQHELIEVALPVGYRVTSLKQDRENKSETLSQSVAIY